MTTFTLICFDQIYQIPKDGLEMDLVFNLTKQNHMQILKMLVRNGIGPNDLWNAVIDNKDVGKRTLFSRVCRYMNEFYSFDAFQFLFENGADINFCGNVPTSPLSYALYAQNDIKYNVVKFCIDNKANLNHTDSYGSSVLMVAIQHSCYDIVKLLIDNGADIQHKSNDGWDCLMTAVNYQKIDIAKLLIECGAKLDNKNDLGCNILMIAVRYATFDMVKLILDSGFSDLNHKNTFDVCALNLAITHNTPKVVKLLIEKNAYVNHIDYEKKTPIFHMIKKKDIGLVQMLINAKADLKHRDIFGNDPLINAIRNDNGAIIQLLIDNKADVNTVHKIIGSPLHQAILNNNINAVKLLIENGADFTSLDEFGNNFLVYACINNSIDIFKLLVHRGVDIYQKNNNKNILQVAAELSNVEMIEYLIKNYPLLEIYSYNSPTLLMHAANHNKVDVIKYFIDSKIDINHVDSSNTTAIMWLFSNVNLDKDSMYDALKLMIEHKADIKFKANNVWPVLTYATDKQKLDSKIVKLFVDNGYDINSINPQGNNCLIDACKNPVFDIDVIKTLIECKSDINLCNFLNLSVLDHAIQSSGSDQNADKVKFLLDHKARTKIGTLVDHIETASPSVVQLLIDHKINPNSRTSNHNGETALILALKYEKQESAEILFKYTDPYVYTFFGLNCFSYNFPNKSILKQIVGKTRYDFIRWIRLVQECKATIDEINNPGMAILVLLPMELIRYVFDFLFI